MSDFSFDIFLGIVIIGIFIISITAIGWEKIYEPWIMLFNLV